MVKRNVFKKNLFHVFVSLRRQSRRNATHLHKTLIKMYLKIVDKSLKYSNLNYRSCRLFYTIFELDTISKQAICYER